MASLPPQVLVLETGRNRFLEVGAVRKGCDFHLRPGCYTGSVAYHADGNIVDGGIEGLTTQRLIEGRVKFSRSELKKSIRLLLSRRKQLLSLYRFRHTNNQTKCAELCQ